MHYDWPTGAPGQNHSSRGAEMETAFFIFFLRFILDPDNLDVGVAGSVYVCVF